MKTIIND